MAHSHESGRAERPCSSVYPWMNSEKTTERPFSPVIPMANAALSAPSDVGVHECRGVGQQDDPSSTHVERGGCNPPVAIGGQAEGAVGKAAPSADLTEDDRIHVAHFRRHIDPAGHANRQRGPVEFVTDDLSNPLGNHTSCDQPATGTNEALNCNRRGFVDSSGERFNHHDGCAGIEVGERSSAATDRVSGSIKELVPGGYSFARRHI